MSTKKAKPETVATHAGRQSAEHFGVVSTPVYRASTILYRTLDALETNDAPYTYGRKGTPTTRSLEEAINALEGAAGSVICTSGANAVAVAILSVCSAGDHLLVADSCYGPTRAFCENTLNRFGITTTFYDPTVGDGIAALFQSNTNAIFCESPGSLTFEVQDIPAIARVAHAKGASVLLDNTWATPVYFDALGHGVDLSIQAATKYVSGHSDAMVGYVAANAGHFPTLRKTWEELGICLGGDDCFLALRGLRTLPLRLKQQQETTLTLTHWLATRPEVERVLYPALESDPGHAIWKRDFKGASGLFGVVLKPVPRRALARFIEGLELFGMGFSWGGFESLIVTSHPKRTAVPREGHSPLLRISAGLEDAGDLIADLEAGFARLGQPA